MRFCAVLIDGILLWIVSAILQFLFTGTLVATQRTRIDPGIALGSTDIQFCVVMKAAR